MDIKVDVDDVDGIEARLEQIEKRQRWMADVLFGENGLREAIEEELAGVIRAQGVSAFNTYVAVSLSDTRPNECTAKVRFTAPMKKALEKASKSDKKIHSERMELVCKHLSRVIASGTMFSLCLSKEKQTVFVVADPSTSPDAPSTGTSTTEKT